MDIANLLSGLGNAASGLLPGLVGQAVQRNLPSGLFAEALAHLLGEAAPQLPATLPTSVAGTTGNAVLSLLEGLTGGQPTASPGGETAEGQTVAPELSLLAGIVALLASPTEGADGAVEAPPATFDPARLAQSIEEVLDSLDEALDGLLTQAGGELREVLAKLAARMATRPDVGVPVGILEDAAEAETSETRRSVAVTAEPARATITPELRGVVAELLGRLNGRVVAAVEADAAPTVAAAVAVTPAATPKPSAFAAAIAVAEAPVAPRPRPAPVALPQATAEVVAVPVPAVVPVPVAAPATVEVPAAQPAPEPSVRTAEVRAGAEVAEVTPPPSATAESRPPLEAPHAPRRPAIALEPEPERLYTRVGRRSERANTGAEISALSRSAAATNEVTASVTSEAPHVRSATRGAVDAEILGRLLERPEPTRERRSMAEASAAPVAEATSATTTTARSSLAPALGNAWTLPEQRAREAVRESGAMRVGLWNRVERAVQDTVASGKSAVVIELKPAHLGDVRVTISATEQAVVARFEAESQTVRAVLESNLHLLRDMLTNAGVDSGRLEVSVGSGGAGMQGGGGYGNRFADAQYRAFEPATRLGTETAMASAPTASPWTAPWRSSSAVDVLA